MSAIQSSLNVLIADDSSVVRERLGEMLAEVAGIKIIGESQNALQTLELMRQMHPDVLILDLSMPDGGGLEVLKVMGHEDLQAEVIVLTNYPYPEFRRRCRALGVTHFLDKSREIEQLIVLLRDLQSSNSTNNYT